MTPAPLSVDRLKEALTASTSRPRVVVVWIHGAEELRADRRRRGADDYLAQVDPHANLSYFLKLIEPAIKMVLGGGSSTADVTDYVALLDAGDSSGCIGSAVSD